jgi:hypothetical protein
MTIENSLEKESLFKIELPKVGDELQLAKAHIQAWKNAYGRLNTEYQRLKFGIIKI